MVSDTSQWRYVQYLIDYHDIMTCDSHMTISFKERIHMGEGEDFSGHVPKVRNAELNFFCKVSLEGNSSHYTLSQIARVKVQTGTCINYRALSFFPRNFSYDN
jgi:hypothetical protein